MASGWRVTGQRGTEDIVGGKFVAVMEVMVETDDGTTKAFRVAEGRYSPEYVKTLVEEWYERHQAVAGL